MTIATVDAAPAAGPTATESDSKNLNANSIEKNSAEKNSAENVTGQQLGSSGPGLSRPPTNPRRRPTGRPATSADPLSDKATILLIRRTLCADETTSGNQTTPGAPASASTASNSPPLTDLLPPLTSRNDVDLQLYGLLAVILREFVQTWYSRITPNGQLTREIVHIVAHCTRALEQRLRNVDLEGLLFDELPTLLDSHVQAYRISHHRLVGHPVETNSRAAYHALIPLPALAPVPPATGDDLDSAASKQAENEAAYRQLLVRGVLAVLLPTEDLANDCLTDLVSAILADLLVGGVLARRVAEPWMMWEIIGMLARLVREKLDEKLDKDKKQNGKAEKEKRSEKSGRSEKSTSSSSSSPSFFSAISPLFWSTVRVGFNICSSLRFLATSIHLARSLPPRRPLSDKTAIPSTSDHPDDSPTSRPPVLAYNLWPTLANLIQLDVRMPWLSGSLSMVQWLSLTGPGRIGAFDGPLDRLLAYYLCKVALDPDVIPILLRATRAAVFPGNKFGATPPTLVAPANATEEAALRRRTAESVWRMVHGNGEQAPSDQVLADIGGVLDLFDDPYCNKHLLYGVLEAILVRLVPEMAETGVLGLWGERLS